MNKNCYKLSLCLVVLITYIWSGYHVRYVLKDTAAVQMFEATIKDILMA